MKNIVFLLAMVIFFKMSFSQADVTLMTSDTWSVSTNGWVNAFAVRYEDAVADRDYFRIRSGYVPNKIAFDIASSHWDGVEVTGRFAVWSAIQNDQTFNAKQVPDIRELNVTLAGDFGQVVIGRMYGLFHRPESYLDIFQGVGFGAGSGNWAANGSLGFGYNFPNFNAGVEYTSPEKGGFQLIVGAFDPSTIGGALTGDPVATVTETPRLEGELDYNMAIGDGASLKLYTSFIYQNAEYGEGDTTGALKQVGDDVTTSGYALGGIYTRNNTKLGLTTFDGDALGWLVFQDMMHVIDSNGEEVESKGFMASLSQGFGRYTGRLVYGESEVASGGVDFHREYDSIRAALLYSVNDYVSYIAEYSEFEGEDEFDTSVMLDDKLFAVGISFMW